MAEEGTVTHIRLSSQACADVDAYVEYRRIVGDADKDLPGGVMTPEQYKHFKKTVVKDRIENRLYVSWTNPGGMDCKLIGPETLCFCGHRYKQHKSDYQELPAAPIPLPCEQHGCRCTKYHYVPVMSGTQLPRCSCKHASEDHDARPPHPCKHRGSSSCTCRMYRTTYRCECGHLSADHELVVDTREERQAKGKPVGKVVPYAAMGGITGFSSLADGYMRLDDSGIGAPPLHELESTTMPAECKYFMPPSQDRGRSVAGAASAAPLTIAGRSVKSHQRLGALLPGSGGSKGGKSATGGPK